MATCLDKLQNQDIREEMDSGYTEGMKENTCGR
jgi:hypothetical protein